MVSPSLFFQLVISGLVIGIIYILMALGITFIYSVMKMINWAMGEFFMIGSYLQWFLMGGKAMWWGGVPIVNVPWFVGVPLVILIVFLLGNFIFFGILRQMFKVENKSEYGTIVTLGMSVLLQNIAVVSLGTYVFSPPDYSGAGQIFGLPISGNRLVSMVATVVLLIIFYIGIRKTWIGRALQATAQNRVGAQCDGINVEAIDRTAFGIGVALAAAAGALLAPVFFVYPTCGRLSTIKGFEIIVLGGMGSIKGAVVGGVLLGLIESVASVIFNPGYRDIYGFFILIFILAVKPSGLFGERKRRI